MGLDKFLTLEIPRNDYSRADFVWIDYMQRPALQWYSSNPPFLQSVKLLLSYEFS